jgi:hypothetical protein
MKKIMLKVILLAMMVGGVAASEADAQTVVTSDTVIVDGDVVECEDDNIVIADDDNYTQAPAATPVTKTVKERNTGVPSWFGSGHIGWIEVGMNLLPSPDYSDYQNNTFLELRNAASLQWTFTLVGLTFDFDRRGIVALSAGAQLTWNNYVLANPVTLVKDDGRLVPMDLQNPKKSKFTSFSLQIPVLLEFNISKNFFIAGGAYGGLNIGSKTKYKFPRTKERDVYMNQFYYGATGRIGLYGFYIYANYGLSELFRENRGPEVAPITIGLGLDF